jgi:hypothetical protein
LILYRCLPFRHPLTSHNSFLSVYCTDGLPPHTLLIPVESITQAVTLKQSYHCSLWHRIPSYQLPLPQLSCIVGVSHRATPLDPPDQKVRRPRSLRCQAFTLPNSPHSYPSRLQRPATRGYPVRRRRPTRILYSKSTNNRSLLTTSQNGDR